MIPGIPDTQFSQIVYEFSSFSSIDSVVLFGSRALGNYKNGSDVDLAIKGAEFTQEDLKHL